MRVVKKMHGLWQRTNPTLRRRIILLFSLLLVSNLLVWLCSIIVSNKHPVFLGLALLAYGLGLRHAVDADHIAAIDNITRKLMLDGKRPVGVGLFFSLGHSSVVILLSLLVMLATSVISHALPSLQAIGTLLGTGVSSLFLLLIGCINLLSFLDIFRSFRSLTKNRATKAKTPPVHLPLRGLLATIFRPLFTTVTSSWQMYFIGLLFGLGFDTASEVGLLSISAASSTTGASLEEILLLPLTFTAGMALIDTLDGVLMLGAYGWAYIKPVRKLYYTLYITFVSVIIALFIGSVEALQLLATQLPIHTSFFQFVLSLNLGNLGYIIILTFILSWVLSLSIYTIKKYDQLG